MPAKDLKIALVTDEMSPLVEAVVNSRFDVVGVVSFDGPKLNTSTGIITKFKSKIFRNILISEFCTKKNVKNCTLSRKEVDTLIEFIASVEPDIVILYCIPLMPEALFSIAKLSTINMHPSMLPLYRGADPSSHMVLNNVREGGITIHAVDAGEDTGDIFLQTEVPMASYMTRRQYLSKAIFEFGIPLLLEALNQIENEEIIPIEQDNENATPRAKKLTNKEILKTIDWKLWSIERVWFTLYFFQERENFLPQCSNWRKWLRPVIRKTYTVNDKLDSSVYGELILQPGSAYFVHPEGEIHIDYPLTTKQILKRLLSFISSS